jgi:hypothetical protein
MSTTTTTVDKKMSSTGFDILDLINVVVVVLNWELFTLKTSSSSSFIIKK